jgi:acyl carrier protein
MMRATSQRYATTHAGRKRVPAPPLAARPGTSLAPETRVARPGSETRKAEPSATIERLTQALVRLLPSRLIRRRWSLPETGTEARVRAIVCDRLGVDAAALAPDVSLVDDLAADSLDLLDVAIAIEDELGVSVPDATIADIRTYRELLDTAETLVRARDAAEADVEASRFPLLVWVRVMPAPSRGDGALEPAGWLTPYTTATILESVRRAGSDARVEIGVPPNVDDRAVARIESALTAVSARGVAVSVRRDPELPPAGQLPGVHAA